MSNPDPVGEIPPHVIYARIGAEWEHYDNLIWQVTATSATFAVGAASLAVGIIDDLWARGAVLIVAAGVLWVLRIALLKHVYFLRTRAQSMEALERSHFPGGVVQRWTVATSDWPPDAPDAPGAGAPPSSDESPVQFVAGPFFAAEPLSGVSPRRLWSRLWAHEEWKASKLLVKAFSVGIVVMFAGGSIVELVALHRHGLP